MKVQEDGENVHGDLENEEQNSTKVRKKGVTDQKVVPGRALLEPKAKKKSVYKNFK